MSAARLLRLVGRRLELPLALLVLGIAWQLLSVRVNNTTLVPRASRILVPAMDLAPRWDSRSRCSVRASRRSRRSPTR